MSVRVVLALSAVVFASFALAAYSFYNGHQQNCQSRNTTLNVLADVISIATTPAPGQKVSDAQKRRAEEFKSRVFARINEARC